MHVRRFPLLSFLTALAAALPGPFDGAAAASVPGFAAMLPAGPAGCSPGEMPDLGMPGFQPEQTEQLAASSPDSPRRRAVADHDHARNSTRAGENRGFEELMRSARSRGRGEYLGVEPDIDRNIYRFKFLRSGGNVVWVDVDGRTGRVIAERE